MTESTWTAADTARILRRVRTLSRRRGAIASEVRSLVDELRERAVGARDPIATKAFLEAISLVPADELTHFDVMALTREHGATVIPQADSFWRSILTRRRKKQLGVVPEKYLGISKDHDERFARLAGVVGAKTLYRGDFSGLPRDVASSVAKPVKSSDSRGAFYVFEGGLYSIAQSKAVADWDAAERLAADELRIGGPHDVSWELQELVTRGGRPAHDLKFYCFYGRIGAILEIARYPTQRYAYFDGDLEPIDFRSNQKPGFDNLAETNVMSGSLSTAKLDTVRKMSLKIPVPFMRIDFLDADDELVFCEFSSAPGLSHALQPDHDQRLGAMYHEAEIRLLDDLLAGKGFDDYKEFGRDR